MIEAQSLATRFRVNNIIFRPQLTSNRSFYPIYTMLNNAFTDRMDKVRNLLS